MIRNSKKALICVALSLVAGAWTPSTAAEDEWVVEARALLASIEQNRADIDGLRESMEQAEGENRVLLDRRLLRKGLETLGNVDALVANVLRQQEQGLDAAEFRTPAVELVRMLAPVARRHIDAVQAEITELGNRRAETTGEELIKLESRIDERNGKINTILEAALDNLEHMGQLGLDTAEERILLARTLSNRAETSSERIRLSLEQTSGLKERLGEKPGDADIQVELSAAEVKQEAATTNLATTIAMMNRLDLETADYQKLLIEATGQITTDLLDTQVALGLFRQWLDGLRNWVVESGPRLIFKTLVFLLILLIFRLLARLTRKAVQRAVSTSKLGFSELLKKMLVATSSNLVLIVGLLVALSQLGFALGPILAGLGIAGFIVGFALQETLANFAAGMMILIYRPFDVGDFVEAAGVFGEVSAMSMVSTTILTIDNQTLVVPNGKIWGDVIKNVTAQKVRRVDMVFGVSYTDDIPHTEKVLSEILAEHPKVLDDPEPMVKLHNLGESSVDFIVRPWVETGDYWDVYWDVTREVKLRFDREGISIPFPQRDVHYYEEKRLAQAAGPAS